MTFGEKVKELRIRKGLSQRQLGERMGGITQQTIAQYEKAINQPKLITIRRIADALDVKLYELVDDWEAIPPKDLQEDFINQHNQCFWSSYLDDKLRQIGYCITYDEDDAMIWIEFPEGTLEVTEAELKELDESTVSYLQFKLEELKKKHPEDFRPRRRPKYQNTEKKKTDAQN